MPHNSKFDAERSSQSETISPQSQPTCTSNEVDLTALKRSSVKGGAVTMVSQAINIAIQLTSIVVLARLLSPEDYGVIAMVLAITGFAGLFRDLGLSSAAIQKKELTATQQSNLFWINLALGASLTAITAASAPLVALFYGEPELTPVTLALSASFLIISLGNQHRARLIREMQFARQAAANLSGASVGLVASIYFAYQGFSYWSLVLGSLIGSIVSNAAVIMLAHFQISLPKRDAGMLEMFKFGVNITGFDIINYFHRNLDNLLIGKFHGQLALGHYSRAYSLLMLPINSIRGPITTVAFPALSRIQNEPDSYRKYYRSLTFFVAFLSMPLTALLFVASEQTILLALGSKWMHTEQIFAILATVGFVQPTVTLWGIVLISLGLTRRYLFIGIINTVCSGIAFSIGLYWGPVGVATGYAIATYLISYPLLLIAFKETPIKPNDFFASVLLPAIASITAAIVSHLVLQMSEIFSTSVEFAICTITFAFFYLLIILLIPKSRNQLMSLLKRSPIKIG